MYKSKYFNLESYKLSGNWTRDEFNFSVEVLESLSRALLFGLLDKFQIKLNVLKENEKFLEDEEIISILLSDARKDNLLDELKRLIESPPLKSKEFSFRKKG